MRVYSQHPRAADNDLRQWVERHFTFSFSLSVAPWRPSSDSGANEGEDELQVMTMFTVNTQEAAPSDSGQQVEQ